MASTSKSFMETLVIKKKNDGPPKKMLDKRTMTSNKWPLLKTPTNRHDNETSEEDEEAQMIDVTQRFPSVNMLSTLESRREEKFKKQLITEFDEFIFSKRGHHSNDMGSTIPHTITKDEYNAKWDLANKNNPLEKERLREWTKHCRQINLEKLCKDQKLESTGVQELDSESKAELLAIRELQLALARNQILDNYPEISAFDRDAAACQVQATLENQVEQKKALRRLPCSKDDHEHFSDLRADDSGILEEAKERENERIRRQNVLDIIKSQIDESELIKRIEWERLQGTSHKIRAANFEASQIGMNELKENEEYNRQFRENLKHQMDYDIKLKAWECTEENLRHQREEEFLTNKNIFLEKEAEKLKKVQEEKKAQMQNAFSITKDIMEEKESQQSQYEEWVIYDTEKRLREKELQEKLEHKKKVLEILKEREFLEEYAAAEAKKKKEQEAKEHKDIQDWYKFEEKINAAKELNHVITADKNKFIVLQQMNDCERDKHLKNLERYNEGTMLKKYRHAYDKVVHNRLQQKLQDQRDVDLPVAYISRLQRQYDL